MRAVFSAVAGLPLLFLAPSLSGSQPAGEPAAAVKAARARQDAAKMLEILFKKREVVAPGGISALALDPLLPTGKVPEKETTLVSSNRLVLDGDKVRFESDHPHFVLPAGTTPPKTLLEVFDGKTAVLFLPKGAAGRPRPWALINKDARPVHVNAMELVPIRLMFRGESPVLNSTRMHKLRATGATLSLGGTACQEYSVDQGKFTTRYWLDPKKGHVLRRLTSLREGRRSYQIDVEYRHDEDLGWVPESWVCVYYLPSGAVRSTTTITVTRLRVNVPQQADQFRTRFPAGTQLYDGRKNMFYLVQPDGTLRESPP